MNAQADSKKLLTKERNAHSVNCPNAVNQLSQPKLVPTNLLDADLDSTLLKDLQMLLAVLAN
jgi:hypothetical protein